MSIMFYNPYQGALGVDLSLVSLGVQLKMALPVNVGERKTPYKWNDDDSKAFFTLNPSECYELERNYAALIKGEYRSKDPKVDPKYAHILTFTHYPPADTSKPSRIAFMQAVKNNVPQHTLCVKFTMPGSSVNFFYPFRVDEQALFYHIIKKGYQDLPYDSLMYGTYGAIAKLERKNNFDNKNTNGNNGNSYNNQSNYSRPNQTQDAVNYPQPQQRQSNNLDPFGSEDSNPFGDMSSSQENQSGGSSDDPFGGLGTGTFNESVNDADNIEFGGGAF